MNPLLFPLLRVLSDGEFHSGETLATRFKVTRATISNVLRQADALDVALFRITGKGYRLGQVLDWLDRGTVLAAANREFDLVIRDQVESTSTVLAREATAGAPHGTVVAAEFQTGGRGRRGREWHAGLCDGLLFSILWRFDAPLPALSGLSLAVGVAIRRALADAGAAGTELKWPNDVVHRYRKLAGVLVDLSGEALGPVAAVIGVGVNVRLAESTRNRIDQAAVDLATLLGHPPRRSELLGRLLAHLARILESFESNGFAPLRHEWETAHAHQNRPVRVLSTNERERIGTAVGVADDGALLLDTGGSIERVLSGQVSLRAP